MTAPLRILIIEDSIDDAQLIMLQLEVEGLNAVYQRVDTEAAFIAALETTPDLILSDYALPQFNGLRALKLLKERELDIPFILISGTVGEDIAANAIKQGADDNLMKDRTARLGSAIKNSLEQKRLRDEKIRADESLHESEKRLELFFSQSLDGFFFMMLDEPVRWDDTVDKEKVLDYVFAHQRITKINDAMLAQYGATREQFMHLTPNDFFAHDLEHGRRVWWKFFDAGHMDVETDERRLDGTQMWIEGDYVCLYNAEGCIIGHFGIQRDITERKFAEEKIRQQNLELKALTEAERQRAIEAETLREAVSATTASLKQEETIERILEQLEQVVPYDSASVQLLHDGYLEIVGGRGWDNPDVVSGIHFPVPGNNPNTIVIQTKKSYILKETINSNPQFRDGPHKHIKSWMGIPLMIGERVLGMLAVDSKETAHFTEDHARLASAFAAHVSIALENARLFEETSQRLENLQALNRVSISLRVAQTKEEMLEILLDESLAIFHANDGGILIYNSASDQLQQTAGRGWVTRLRESMPRSGVGIVGRVFASGKPHISHDVANDPLIIENIRHLIPAGWCQMTVPIRTSEEFIGVMHIAFKQPRQIQTSEIELLTTIAEMAGSAIHRASLHALTEHRLRNLESLHEIERVISSNLDVRITLNLLLDKAISRLNVQAASVLLFDPYTYALNYAAGHGFHTHQIERTSWRLGEGNAGIAAQERRIVAIPDLSREECGAGQKQLIKDEGFVSYYCAPLIAKGKIKGVFETYHRSSFTADSEWIDFLETLATQAAVAIDNAELFEGLQRSNLNLALAYDATIEGWSRALDLRDKETEGHSQRVTTITLKLAQAINVEIHHLIHIRRGALLHDIGKMGIPDAILLKNGKLTDEEWEIMRRHPTYAYEMLLPIEYLKPALDIPYCHHEKWDGNGYPRRLKGEEIPLAARIFAVADVWDALTSDRVYRKKWSRDETLASITSETGKHFDPNVVKHFLNFINEQGDHAD